MAICSINAGRKAIISSLKNSLKLLSGNALDFISRINTTPIDQVPRASVLAPIYLTKNNEKLVFLTVRTESLAHHPGEVCFPGGKRDKMDASDIDTALREMSEELGIEVDEGVDEILGVLPPTLAKQELLVVPIVAMMKGLPSTLPPINNAEVASTFMVPLENFLLSKYHSTFEGTIKAKWSPTQNGSHAFRIHTFNFKEDDESIPIIWGMTAQILIQLAQAAFPEKMIEFEFEPQNGPSYLHLTERQLLVNTLLDSISVAFKVGVFSIIVREYLYDVAIPTGPSMKPTLSSKGDAILIQKKWLLGNRPLEIGDIVTVISPIEPRKIICKRIAAREGESIPVLAEGCSIVPKGHIWLLGDNLDESMDSRHYGPVPIGLIQGKAICKILPIGQLFNKI